jgi:hypothetical protein
VSWSLTPDEFAHIWRRADLDRIPYPLRVLESPRTERDARLLRTELAQRLPPDPDLDACLRILALPQTRVIANRAGNCVYWAASSTTARSWRFRPPDARGNSAGRSGSRSGTV